MKPRARTGPGIQLPLRRAILACSLALAALALPAVAEAKRNVYVANNNSGDISAYDVAADGSLTALGSSPFTAVNGLGQVAASPDGEHLYLPGFSGGVYAYDVSSTGTLSPLTGSPFAAGVTPSGVAASPDGKHVYVSNSTFANQPDYSDSSVSAYSVATDGSLEEVAGSPFPSAANPHGVAISPDGRHLYAASSFNGVSAYDIASDGSLSEVTGSPFAAGTAPEQIVASPDGEHLYVSNYTSSDVSAYDIGSDGSLDEVAGSPFVAGTHPLGGSAVTPDGNHLYVSNVDSSDVSAYDIAADGTLTEMAGSPFSAGVSPFGVTASPDGKHLYVSNQGGGVSAYDIAADGTLTEMTGSQFAAGTSPFGVVVTPNQPPVASFTSGAAEAGSPTSFNASASTDPDGTVARFDWDFGDGNTVPDGGPTPTHTYASVGNYDVTVTLTDNEGCSTTSVYTGQTTSCNGSPVAEKTKAVAVTSPPAPTTKIKGKPKYEQAKDTRFRFSSSIDGSKFKCRLDKSKYKGCTSPKNYKNLKPGKHTFHVYAISPAGVADESPAKLKFKVKGKQKG